MAWQDGYQGDMDPEALAIWREHDALLQATMVMLGQVYRLERLKCWLLVTFNLALAAWLWWEFFHGGTWATLLGAVCAGMGAALGALTIKKLAREAP